ncbi:MAG: prolipoprotein diacylglyceryl transferase, partial [Alphaproteobacteria bacterium]
MIINVPNFNPVAFSLSIIEVRWYSLAYIFGILYSYQFLKFSNKKYNFISLKALDEWMLYAILSILIGGRIGYVLFYNLSYFIENPIEILAFWHGGMSFHGGLIGAVLGMWLFSKKYNLNLWNILDNLAVSAPFALMLGRIAN